MHNFKTTITQEDINYGMRMNGISCPIAISLKRKGFKNIHVGLETTEIDGNTYRNSIRTSKFVENFDDGKDVKPAAFIFKIVRSV